MVDNIINDRSESLKALKKQLKQLSQLAKRNQSLLVNFLTEEVGKAIRMASRYSLSDELVANLSRYIIYEMFTNNEEVFNKYMGNIEKAVVIGQQNNFGMKLAKMSYQETAVYKEVITQDALKYVTKMTNDTRTQLINILTEGLRKDLMPTEIRDKLSKQLKISQNRANTIARTEILRANNQINYEQALANDAKYFIVDNREEACEECQAEYEGEVFDIDNTNALPPLHPNCACIPEFFDNKEEAQGWVDGIQQDNIDRRDALVDKGYVIAPDGTGAVKEEEVK